MFKRLQNFLLYLDFQNPFIQSDQGSNFIPGLFQQVMQELGIKQFRSSAYHPEGQGALERFHHIEKHDLDVLPGHQEKFKVGTKEFI